MNKILKYIFLAAVIMIIYGFSITDSLSADSDSESQACKQATPSPSSPSQLFKFGDLIIENVMPNPKGKDQGMEWIELKNTTSNNISLLHIILIINDKKYDLPNITIAPEQKLHVLSKELKVILPNKATTLLLQDLSGKEIDRLKYPDAKDDIIFSHGQKITMDTRKTDTKQLKLPISGNNEGILAGAGATFLIRLLLKDRIS